MSDSERDDMLLGFEDQTSVQGTSLPLAQDDSAVDGLPMDGLLAELLGNWQEADSESAQALVEETESPAPDTGPLEPPSDEPVSVFVLMERLLDEEPVQPGADSMQLQPPAEEALPVPEALQPLEAEAAAAEVETAEVEAAGVEAIDLLEAAPEPYVDLESLSIVPADEQPAAPVMESWESPLSWTPVLDAMPLEAASPDVPVEQQPEPVSAAVEPDAAPLAIEQPEQQEQQQPEPAEAVASVETEPETVATQGMPDDGSLRVLLSAMKQELAESVQPRLPVPQPDAGRVTERFLAFQLAGESYAVPLTRVMETDRLPKVTNVPGLPPFVMGVANLRGSILPLVDLAMLLEMDQGARPHDARILVVKPSREDTPVALVVDALQGVAMLAREELHHTPQWLDGRTTSFLEGIGSHKGRLLSVLDLDRVFAASALRDQPAA